MNYKFVAIFLVLLCCFMGAVNAADDVSTDAVDASVDDAVAVDAVSEDIGDSVTDDPILSEDTTNEEINEATIEKENNDVEQTRGTPTTANNWTELADACENSTDMEITLTGTSYNANRQIYFSNSATIIGTESSYITAGTYTEVPFLNEDPDLTITFINVKFRNMNVNNLLELAGTTILENCTFYKINAATGHNSVIYNTDGTMSLIGCNITNCSAGYGVVSNYKAGSVTDVVMYVDNCKFINNSASVEPGGINNCGILYVNNSEFTNNSAGWWAGAIHTHSNAQTYINNTNFTGNIAGWNGGALYTYSKLVVCNSIFKENKCRTSAGGGAIGCSNYGSAYNITICNCTFEDNENLCGHTNETPSTGTGGAISAMNNGILKVCGSTFIHNVAKTGQAIAAYSQGYISPEGNITEGIPKVIVCNNTFTNHTLKTSDTVKLTGNYTFSFNTFNNCYQTNLGTNNTFNNPVTSNTPVLSEELSDSQNEIKLSSKNILGDDSPIDERYVSTASELKTAYNEISDNGIIYLSDGSYNWQPRCANLNKSVTFIGQSKNTIITLLKTAVTAWGNPNPVLTFINITFESSKPVNLTMNSNFINCSFINPNILIADGIAKIEHLDEKPFGVTYNLTFDNCEFKDSNIANSLFTVYTYGKVVLTNCSFDNIVADSIIGRSGDFIDQDGIYLYDCSFTNCNIKGVVDIPGNIEIPDYCAIEDCDYDFDATTDIAMVGDYAHNYLNATKLKVVAVDSAVDISSSEKGVVVITLTDGANPIAGATVKYTVNGAEEQTVTTGEDGKATISGLTGEVTIAVNYEGNESYNAISDTKSFNFTEEPVVPAKVATKITAPKVTATYNVAKNLVITLTDKDGKVLANKKVTVKVGTISKTLTTNTKGQVSLNVATLVPKTYTATVKFAGDDSYIASSLSPKVVISKAKPQIVAKAKTFKVKTKTKKYTVTLKNNKGKVLKKVKLTLKVGKKTYKATTNSKGKATFKITKLTKKGKYTATIKFAGSKYYKALSKKAKITVKK
ncbi:hypothetical protein [Methanobrevibacter ruminantium]|uniref:Ig-like domain-containing protein n=1 Tax=Methanobrevibacter ruminantium TaxID=83816 RepID=UPI0026EE0608|nr:hypothetical protein [Methanobrevibacter ruminantium]